MMRNLEGSLSATFEGTGIFAASSTRSPYPMRRPEPAWITWPSFVDSSEEETPSLSAAAATIISRAAAPASRMGLKKPRTAVEPPVICAPSIGLA